MKKNALFFAALLSCSILISCTSASPPSSEKKPESAESKPAQAKSPAGAKVYFIDLKENATLTNPIRLKFGADVVQVSPAGEVKDNSGHHHLLIDVDSLPPLDKPLPANDHIRHFGKGQTEAEITLPPGEHTLQLLLAGGNHVPNDPPVMSDKIKVTVK